MDVEPKLIMDVGLPIIIGLILGAIAYAGGPRYKANSEAVKDFRNLFFVGVLATVLFRLVMN